MPTTNTCSSTGAHSALPHYRASVPRNMVGGAPPALKVFQQKRRFLGKEGILPQGCSIFSLSFQPASLLPHPPMDPRPCQSLNHYANSFKEPFNIYTSALLDLISLELPA